MIDVTAAILIHKKKLLIARRAPSGPLAGKWEFPGGKVEERESPEACLKREIKEEFGVDVEIGEFFAENIHHYEHLSIRLLSYLTTLTAGNLVPRDHDAIAWVTAEDLDGYDFAPADLPFVDKIKHLKHRFFL